MFRIRLSCLRTTPFGVVVDPDVYWIIATVVASMFGATQSSASAETTSIRPQVRSPPSPSVSSIVLMAGCVSDTPSAKRARASGTTEDSRGANRSCTGTATAPA